MRSFFVLVLLLSSVAGAQSARNPYLDRARALVQGLEEQEALEVLDKARAWPGNSAAELAQAHVLTGVAQAALSRESEAKQSFSMARMLDPDIQLPFEVSPRIEALFHATALKPQQDVEPIGPAVPALTTELPKEEPSAFKKWAPPTLLAAAVLSLGGALVAGASARGQEDAANKADRVGQAQSLHRSAQDSAVLANVLFGAAGAMGVTAGVVFVW